MYISYYKQQNVCMNTVICSSWDISVIFHAFGSAKLFFVYSQQQSFADVPQNKCS